MPEYNNDNEKAAFFLGWTPVDPCMSGIVSPDGYCVHGRYGDCNEYQEAPDMTVANNYIKALQHQDIRYFSIDYIPGYICVVVENKEYFRVNTAKLGNEISIGFHVVYTLARMYDKLHS